MRDIQLKASVDADSAIQALADIEMRLLEQFPKAGLDVIHGLLFRILNEGAVLTAGPALGASNDVIRLEVRLDASLVFEIAATALGAAD